MSVDPDALLRVHVAATWALVGLIWTVQVVQYPGFRLVGDRELATFHERHCRRISRVVAPLMLVELATGLLLVRTPPGGIAPGQALAGLVLIAVNWLATAAFSVPLHRRLQQGERASAPALVRTNWLRTAAWSARGVLTLGWVTAAAG